MPALCNGYIPHQEVRGQVTGSESVVSGLQQRETGDASSSALLFVDHQPVGMETPARVQVEVKHWEDTADTGEDTIRDKQRLKDKKGGQNFRSERRRSSGGNRRKGVEIYSQKAERRTKERRRTTERRRADAPPPVSTGTEDTDPDDNSFHHKTLTSGTFHFKDAKGGQQEGKTANRATKEFTNRTNRPSKTKSPGSESDPFC